MQDSIQTLTYSLILVNIFETSASPPSATCNTEIPSFAFLFACPKPRIFDRIPSEIERPAALSEADVIDEPDAKCAELLSATCEFLPINLWACIAARFVEILKAITNIDLGQ